MTETEALGWGILGTGYIADLFTHDLKTAGLRVAAVASRSAERARAFADEHGIPHAHGSAEALVADPTVDAVYVATPHPLHAEAALLALEHGKHVLVEKAFTLNAREAEGVVALGRARGLVVLEAMWTRFLPHMIEIRGLLRDGVIGEPKLLLADHLQALSTDPEHRINAPALGGGALLDLGVYPISFGVDLFGLPSTVEATATFTATGVDERVSAILVHDGGAHTVLTAALNLPGPNPALIVGTEGSITIDGTWYMPTAYTVRNADREIVRQSRPAVPGRGMQFQALELESLVRAGRTGSDLLPPEESVGIMAVMDDIRRRIGLRYPQESAAG